MCDKRFKDDVYEDTVGNSKEISIQKALAIFMEYWEKNEPIVERPNIKPGRGILKILISVMFLGVLSVLFNYFRISPVYIILFTVFVVVVNAKRMTVWSILIYQKYAPERIRKSCVFEPSCSNYMIISINKFGLIKGVLKGIKRLLRCHPPNGGIDNP